MLTLNYLKLRVHKVLESLVEDMDALGLFKQSKFVTVYLQLQPTGSFLLMHQYQYKHKINKSGAWGSININRNTDLWLVVDKLIIQCLDELKRMETNQNRHH